MPKKIYSHLKHPSYTPALGALFLSYIFNAKNRHHLFSLTFDDFLQLIYQPCFYCHRPPFNVSRRTKIPLVFTGIDRRDNSQGYLKKNCIPCCKDCNRAKHAFSEDLFLNQIKKIYERFN